MTTPINVSNAIAFLAFLAACSTRAPAPQSQSEAAAPVGIVVQAQAPPGAGAASSQGKPGGALTLQPSLNLSAPIYYTLAPQSGGGCAPLHVIDQASRDGGANHEDVYPDGCDPCVKACSSTMTEVYREGWRSAPDPRDGLQKVTGRFAWCVQRCREVTVSAIVASESYVTEPYTTAMPEGHVLCAVDGLQIDDLGTITGCLAHNRCSRGRSFVQARIDCERLSDGGAR